MTLTKKRIRVTYEVITPESAANGDVAESGWLNEEGIDCRLPSLFSPVDRAIDRLSAEGVTSDGGYWMTAHGDMQTDGSITNKSYHFVDGEWSEAEKDSIHSALTVLPKIGYNHRK